MEGKEKRGRPLGQEWCYCTGCWKRITASWRRKLDIVLNGAVGRTNLPRKAENQGEEEEERIVMYIHTKQCQH